MRRQSVAIDLDGTLAAYDGWKGLEHIGDPLPGAQDFVRGIREFAKVVIWTTRSNYDVNGPNSHFVVKAWLDKHGFEYDEIFVGPVKPLVAAFVDDRAVTCRPQEDSDAATAYRMATLQVKELCG